MRKVLSLILVAAMLVCGMVLVPTSASAATLDKHNVAAEARYFGGTVDYTSAEGPNGGVTFADTVTIKKGDSAKGTININGTIEEGEWGEPIAVIDNRYAANNGGKEYGRNVAFETPSAENTYYFYNVDDKGNSLNPAGIAYTLYMMWDEDFLYVAAYVDDKDGNINTAGGQGGGEQCWNGDSLQVRVDTKGPNSATGGKDYDAKGNTPNEHNLDTFAAPWADIQYDDHRNIQTERVSNFIFAYVLSGYTEAWDAALRHEPVLDDKNTDLDGNPKPIERGTQSDMHYDSVGDGGIYATVYSETYFGDDPSFYMDKTAYEIAIPWKCIEEGYTPAVGSELGVATTLFNANSNADDSSFNAWLTWGSGVCASQMRYDPQTCGGSNCLVLSSEPYNAAGHEHVFKAADCTAPETCEICGYQRGYKTGHDYSFKDFAAPTSSADGTITAVCDVCGDTYTQTIKSRDADILFDFHTDDLDIADQGLEGFTNNWRLTNEVDEKNERVGPYLEVDVRGVKKVKTAYDYTTFPEVGAVLDLYTSGKQFDPAVADDVNNVDQTGTYFSTSNEHKSTYTYKTDVLFPSLEDIEDSHYCAGFRNWFGDNSHKKYGYYGAGLYKVEGNYYFAIIDAARGEGASISLADFKSAALACVPVDADDLELNKWHTYAFAIDEDSSTAMVAWDGEVKVFATDYHMSSNDSVAYTMFRRFNIGGYLKDVEIGGLNLFSQYASTGSAPATKFTATIDGVATEYSAGDKVQLNAAFHTEGVNAYRFDEWTGDVDVLADASEGVTVFVMPERNVTLNSSYILVGDVNTDGAVNAKDSLALKMLVLKGSSTKYSDVDDDSYVNSKDTLMLKRIIVGYIPEK